MHCALSIDNLIDKYYPEDNELKRILLTHSRMVADRALLIARRHPELQLNETFLEQAAMLHDIGIFKTDAPGIQCFGIEPYILHGRIGAELLRQEGLPDLARVCERHTGTGITAQQIIERNLPLPVLDFIPETMEEQVICYADKFYSKSHLERERTVEQTAKSLEKFGHDSVARFTKWSEMFE